MKKILLVIPLVIIIIGGIIVFSFEDQLVLPFAASNSALRAENEGPAVKVKERKTVMPESVRGIYVSAATAGSTRRFNELVHLVDTTELNALVIDIKDDRGALAFHTDTPYLAPFIAKHPELGNLKEFTAPLREKGIYLIARLFVFQDPFLVEKKPELAIKNKQGGIWRDRRGTPWVDPASTEVWDYNVSIAREAFFGGFDEIQFDYIRFPSDGNMQNIAYPIYDSTIKKPEVIENFFAHLDNELRKKSKILISADLFGLTMVHHEFDLGIGQLLSSGMRHFDVVSPMVYPSHYPKGYIGYSNPAAHPYEVIAHDFDKANVLLERMRSDGEQIGTIRHWIQDFHLGAEYTPEMVRSQMRAGFERGASGYLVWNARNVYTESAFAKE